MTPFWANPGFYLYFAAWLPFVLFVGFYGLRSPWRSTRVGIGLFVLSASIVAVLTNVLVFFIIGTEHRYQDSIRSILIGGVALAGWYQLWNLLRTQRQGRRGRPDSAAEELASRRA